MILTGKDKGNIRIDKLKKIKFLLTAHHLDDEIENFLMRLMNSST